MGDGAAPLADVTLVVTTHDAGPDLPATLRALLGQGPFARALVVDSGSGDGSPDAVESDVPGVEVVRLGANRGPCATRNRGLAEARTPYVLLVDHDMGLDAGCAATLRCALEADPGAAMAGPRIFHAADRGRVQYEGGWWHYAGLPHMRGADRPPARAATQPVDVLTSGCVLARREAALAAGGFDEKLFFLMEDVELSLRLRCLGHRLLAVPAARAFNVGASAGLSLGDGTYPARRARLHARNRLLVVVGLYDPWTLLVLWPALALMDAAWFGFSLLAGRPGAFVAGRVEALRGLPAAVRRRRTLRGRKRVADRVLLKAPPLTFTAAALEQPLARHLTGLLDGCLRVLHVVLRRLLP